MNLIMLLLMILHGNNLIGTILKELGMLKSLKVLDMGENQLTGPSNGLIGRLPPKLRNLKYLQELRLDRNKIQGPVPAGGSSNFSSNIHGMYASVNSTGFCRSSQLKVTDFSYNFLVGSIPKCLEYLPRGVTTKSSIIIPWKTSSSGKDHTAVYIESEMLKDVMRYGRQDLEVACEDFSNIIGSSLDSVVY
ncbi:hypothetical protein RJT34_12145 [Clitoria ternatea]|uniref:Uncharacterized protein n=1 Tax=Clitoria ternatea TaxID=43366 RepID=A0AAN9JPU1_CLITE